MCLYLHTNKHVDTHRHTHRHTQTHTRTHTLFLLQSRALIRKRALYYRASFAQMSPMIQGSFAQKVPVCRIFSLCIVVEKGSTIQVSSAQKSPVYPQQGPIYPQNRALYYRLVFPCIQPSQYRAPVGGYIGLFCRYTGLFCAKKTCIVESLFFTIQPIQCRGSFAQKRAL